MIDTDSWTSDMKGQGAMARQVMPEIDQAICILCGHCVNLCPHGALSLSEHIHLDGALCSYCGDCESICPVGAIALPYEIVIEKHNTPGGKENNGQEKHRQD